MESWSFAIRDAQWYSAIQGTDLRRTSLAHLERGLHVSAEKPIGRCQESYQGLD